MRNLFILILFIFSTAQGMAQVLLGDSLSQINYGTPREYEIGGITVTGAGQLDANVLRMISGLSVGDRISVPGEKIANAIDNLWSQGLFSNVQVYSTKITGDIIFLEIRVEDRPRMKNLRIENVRKSELEDLREELGSLRGQVATNHVKANIARKTKAYFVSKGFLNTTVVLNEEPDTASNSIVLVVDVDKGPKVKVAEVNFSGNQALSDGKLRRAMKETHRHRWYFFFRSAKFIEDDYEADKQAVIDKYNAKGYRDARIVSDTVYQPVPGEIVIDIKVDEGGQYYFRNINWVGNTKHSDAALDAILGIRKGDVYNQSMLETRLFMNPNGGDVSSLYMDDGYLFFSVTPVEVHVENDSIDLEMRIYEGRQARVNKVTIVGNSKTNDHVILREIRTKPGDLFSRSDIIRTQRELAQLGYFDPEKLAVNPKPNPAEGTVDIEYVVEERPSDQLELSGGWGAGRVVGTLGVSFNNFSARNIFKKNAWQPLPSGDGQRLSLRAQSTGLYYNSQNFSFTEPWLGGKKPNSFTISLYRTTSSNGQKQKVEVNGEEVDNPDRQAITIMGGSLGLGKRLQWPDDYFTLYLEAGIQQYRLNNYQSFIFTDGISNNLSGKIVLSRNSIDQPIYPRSGSQTSITLQLTPPYSLFSDKDYGSLEVSEKYKWTEYHKWKFTSAWYSRLAGNLVLYTKAGFGLLGLYDRDLGITPFERFSLGGSGLSGAGGTAFFLGKEIIALRGYSDNSIPPAVGGSLIGKYTMELRYPVSLNPNATVYLLTFAEAGNMWSNFRNFNPFDVKRSAGAGIRVYLPMFGLLGLDWGYRFDDVPGKTMDKSQLHFSIGFNLGEL